MEYVIDVDRIQPVAREHSDNRHILRRDDLKVGLISVRPHDALPVHTHDRQDQFYYVLAGEGTVQMDGRDIALRPGLAVTIPPGVPHGVDNPNDVPLVYLDVYVNWTN